ncbi:MAG: hypothetical protein J7599_21400 [Niabella sp.]|nr:hypothetical protein [Niabella sp.]
MKQLYYLLASLVFLTSCGNAQPGNLQKLTGNIPSDLKALLPNRTVKADIMDGVVQSSRQVALAKKLQSAIKANYDWFLEYMKSVPEGAPMPYDQKLGLTKEEYEELIGFMDNMEVVSTGKEDMAIVVKNDSIRFQSHNKLAGLDSLIIDLKNNMVTFGKYKLAFSDTLNITTDKNALKSKWKGYSWVFEDPKEPDVNAFKDLDNLKMKQYKFTIGRLEKMAKPI